MLTEEEDEARKPQRESERWCYMVGDSYSRWDERRTGTRCEGVSSSVWGGAGGGERQGGHDGTGWEVQVTPGDWVGWPGVGGAPEP